MIKARRLVEMEEQNNLKEEERNVDSIEFSLTGEEINELISKLNQLKETKVNFLFEVDDENEFIIHYDNEEETD